MQTKITISEDIRYIGVNDPQITLFEGQYKVEKGMAYNSYLISDEKTAVLDTVDADWEQQWLDNVQRELAGRMPDYLIIQHMEPDHSACINAFVKQYPDVTLVSTAKAFDLMRQFYGTDFSEHRLLVKEGDTLSLGRHTLHFIQAPMVHWPEVMFTYDETDKVLFSADAFGKFGVTDAEEDWACEARRYYIGIVGKYGMQVQNVLKKAAALEISTICPLHGPVLTENLGYYLNLYQIWSSYAVESEGVTIAYASVYGHTEEAVKLLEQKLLERGCPKVALNNLNRCDIAEAVEDAFRYGKLVLASITYNMEIFPFMREFLADLVERGYKNRQIGLIENGSWAPAAAKNMRKILEPCKDLTFAETTVTLLSALNDQSRAQIEALAAEIWP